VGGHGGGPWRRQVQPLSPAVALRSGLRR
jgi:hypothetical protein